MSKMKLGGQAVIEGIMLKSENYWTLGIRNQNNEIELQSEILKKSKRFETLWKLPLFRGIKALGEAFTLGYKTLSISAYKAAETEEEDGEELTPWHMAIAIIIAMSAATGLFVITPAFFIKFLYTTNLSSVAINILEGSLKIFILAAYIRVISFMPDIKRVFEYHGAEHAVIHAVEKGEELVPNDKMAQNIRHMRCGTSFLMLVMITSVLIFSLLGKPPFLTRVLYHLAIVPFVAGISYEIIKFAGNHSDNKLVQILMVPGLTMQRMTTRVPDTGQLEVAIATVKELIRLEESAKNEIVPGEQELVIFEETTEKAEAEISIDPDNEPEELKETV